MAHSNSADDEDDAKTETFRFFDLPLELRNGVYSLLTKVVPRTTREIDDSVIETSIFWLTTPRLLNHQFKQKYEDEVLRYACITLAACINPTRPDLCTLVRSHRSVCIARHLTIRTDLEDMEDQPYKSQIDQALRCLKADLPKLLPLFPDLRTLTLEIEANALDIETSISDHGLVLSDFFTAQPLFETMNANHSSLIHVSMAMLLMSRLYSVNPDVVRDRGLDELLMTDKENGISYRITTSVDPTYPWQGMELEVVSAGTLAIEAAEEEMFKRYLDLMDEERDGREAARFQGFNAAWDRE
ncbi:hypothetical protein LTR36_004047 [Oleoguttula mirabilis]|uniref:Uncharacterized protein n=1 Tax=Oleoguttula mirabilis TaxID=1507867 RepID=A0AAV9JJW7_9PEZI|nr:hypothetical protein LTR36_004047 [Oleoguttula mirabilis]